MSEHVLVDETLQTGVALIMVEEHSAQNRIIVVSGASGSFTAADMPAIWKGLEPCGCCSKPTWSRCMKCWLNCKPRE